MDLIEFCEDVLGHPLYDWQKIYLTEMYDMLKKAKEENKEVNIIMPGRGSSKNRVHIAALLFAHEYDKYLDDLLTGRRMNDIESLNAIMGPVEMIRSNEIDKVLEIEKDQK